MTHPHTPPQDPDSSEQADSAPAPPPLTPAQLTAAVYQELHALASYFLQQERAGHTLQPTALVHEAYLKLADKTRIEWRSKPHFVAVAAEAMRRVLVDHARSYKAVKRGGGRARMQLDAGILAADEEIDLLALDDAMNKLTALDARHGRVVELRFFGGLSVEQTAEILGVSARTVEMDWSLARAWLRQEMSGGAP
ncbi:MAG: sigma-70 family RNA polymerase sigma factor [Pyrinomonadaceae bacterium]|nr:sigma-70 family RNA polymerase sigma factor [Phycisphaerales bacterium]